MLAKVHSDASLKYVALVCSTLCFVGASAAFFVVLVRVPALADTKTELLFGTLQGTAVGLLFAIMAVLVNLTYMIRRATRPLSFRPTGDELSR
jgi:hypothetical protein